MLNEIKKGLNSPDYKVRKKYVMLLSRIDKPEVINILKPLLNDEIQEIRNLSKKIIDYLNEKYKAYSELICSEEKNKIKTEIENSSFDPSKLIELILSDDIKVKISSIMSFYGVKNIHVLKTFIKFILLEENPLVLATYIKAIGSIGGTQEINLLRKYLSHNDNRVKSNTIEALSELGSYEEIIEDILPLTQSNDDRLKITAEQYIDRLDFDVLLSVFKELITHGQNQYNQPIINITLRYPIDKTIDFFDNIYSFFTTEQKNNFITSLKNIDLDIANDFILNHKFVSTTNSINDNVHISQPIIDLKNDIDYAEAFFNDGIILFKNQEFDKAILEFDKAIKINPKHFETWYHKALAFTFLNNHKETIGCLEKALSIRPNDVNSHNLKNKTLKIISAMQELNTLNEQTDFIPYNNSINDKTDLTNPSFEHTQSLKTDIVFSKSDADNNILNLMQKSKSALNTSAQKISTKVNQTFSKSKELYKTVKPSFNNYKSKIINSEVQKHKFYIFFSAFLSKALLFFKSYPKTSIVFLFFLLLFISIPSAPLNENALTKQKLKIEDKAQKIPINFVDTNFKNNQNTINNDEDKKTDLNYDDTDTNVKKIFMLLESEQQKINDDLGNGNNFLHHAVRNNQYNLCKFLIKMGININAINDYNDTPLSIAISTKNKKILKLLIDNSALTNNFNIFEKLIFSKSPEYNFHKNVYDEYIYSINNSDIEMIFFLYKHSKIDLNAKIKLITAYGIFNNSYIETTPLHALIRNLFLVDEFPDNNVKLIAWLIKNVKDINVKDENGNPPIFFGLKYLDFLKLVIEMRPDLNLNTANNEGQTALDIAVKQGYIRTAEYLKSKNAVYGKDL